MTLREIGVFSGPFGTPRRRWEPVISEGQALIPLTRSLFAIIDEADLELISAYAWSAVSGPNTHYARTQIKRRVVFMHRIIAGALGADRVDHDDRDGLNNRRVNLISCTHAENSRKRVSSVGASKFKGVAFHSASGLYHATITLSGRQISLKYHKTEAEAARAYDGAAIKYFGRFALTNKDMGLL